MRWPAKVEVSTLWQAGNQFTQLRRIPEIFASDACSEWAGFVCSPGGAIQSRHFYSPSSFKGRVLKCEQIYFLNDRLKLTFRVAILFISTQISMSWYICSKQSFSQHLCSPCEPFCFAFLSLSVRKCTEEMRFGNFAIWQSETDFPGFVHVVQFEEILTDCYYLCHFDEAYQLLSNSYHYFVSSCKSRIPLHRPAPSPKITGKAR